MEVDMRSSGMAIAVASLALVGGVGTARAAFTGPGAAVHGCVGKHGAVTVVKFKSKCHKGLRSIVFGARGAAGTPADSNEINMLKSDVSSLQSTNATLTSKVNSLDATLAGVTRTGNTLLFSGMNLQLESGGGSTSATPNGLGNLLIGYNESPGTQTGSNNLVVGDGNSFTSFGGLVAGNSNGIAGPYAAVTGGDFNLAKDAFSSVTGGCRNVAGTASTPSGNCLAGAQAVLGGFENSATGLESTVSGGEVGTASGGTASIAGGQFNTASGGASSVLGGDENTSSGSFAAVLGGFSNSATMFDASVSGGESNLATGTAASVLGGHGNTAAGSCQAIPAAVGTC
jgi:hypothetical protein